MLEHPEPRPCALGLYMYMHSFTVLTSFLKFRYSDCIPVNRPESGGTVPIFVAILRLDEGVL